MSCRAASRACAMRAWGIVFLAAVCVVSCLAQPESPTFRVNTSVVLVPTLVEMHSGDVVYTLKPDDFILEDNGVPQKIQVDEDFDQAPVSLIVAIEKGRTSLLQFQKISRIGPLVDLFLGQGRGEAAVVTFDSQPQLLTDFTDDTEAIGRDLQRLQPGDGGAAILDTVSYCIDLLEQQPSNRRRVLLLISESRDHGSKHVDSQQLIERLGTSNTLVLSVTYSAAKAEVLNDVKGGGAAGSTINILSPMMMAIAAVRKNVAKEIAVMSGGEYVPFTREKAFQDSIAEVAKHARNRYLLSFHPTDRTPGLHTLRVRLAQDYGAHVVARTSYWAAKDEAEQGR
ncbi:MAG TPA: VWA domain-containing protein [Acidisarcina sp.]|nr:VWA domain-containing protein [Acidisarcina sp.]